MTDMDREGLLTAIRSAVAAAPNAKAAMTQALRLLKDALPYYSWAGIYLLEGDELVLGPYFGKPSPHTRIPLGRGICGAAAYSGIAVSGRIGQLQREIGVAPSSLPEGDARRAEFGRLHGLSTALQLVPVLGGLMLMYWEIKE